MAALLRRPAWVLLICALLLLGLSASAFGSGLDVLADAKDDRVDGCYSRAEFRDALSRARDDQRLYANAVDIINEAAISHVTIPGQPCGSGRTVPPSAVPVASSGAATLWGAVALLVSVGAIGAGTLAHRRGASGPGR